MVQMVQVFLIPIGGTLVFIFRYDLLREKYTVLMILENKAQSLMYQRIERFKKTCDYATYSQMKMEGKNMPKMKTIVDYENYKYGLDLLEKLLEVLPEEVTREEAILNVEEAIYCLRKAVKDEA